MFFNGYAPSKKSTPWWREAHLEVKSVKICHLRTFGLFSDVGNSKMCRRPRCEASCEVKTQEIEGFWAFLSVRTDRDGLIANID